MSISLATGHNLHWLGGDGEASLVNGTLAMSVGPRTDWFIDPGALEPTANAPVLVAAVDGNFQLAARVEVDFAATFDAGVLFVHHSNDVYAKLCFELSPAGEQTVVSVVTRSESDDANGPVVDDRSVWLRVSRVGPALAFHWSVDGAHWNMVRYFQLSNDAEPLSAGFCAQSPTGDGCTARFSDIVWTPTTLAHVRDGS